MQTEKVKNKKLSIKITDLKEFEEVKEGLSYKKIIASRSAQCVIYHLKKKEKPFPSRPNG